ncbi:hypothetical protein F4861DRAFT_487940 [Xylaria intraflava]|nr:hypothetical protein F4861DRAFT_487940 [Xylaria intraflava]
MKLLSFLTLATAATAAATPKRMTTVAGVEVIDTRIVRDVRAYIRQFPDYLFSHQTRSWLFGAAAIQANETLRNTIDLEVHAVATMLHDLGWDPAPNSRWVSKDKRFEIDGAIGARTWLSENAIGKHWAPDRVRKVFQAISLHGTQSIAEYYDLDIATVVASIAQDYQGPNGITQETYDNITKAFPQNELISGTNSTFVWFATTKPATTYDTWLEPWGNAYVPGYSAVGHRSFDGITGNAFNTTKSKKM